jgi:hypothetical protein
MALPVPMTNFSTDTNSHPGLLNGLMPHQSNRNYSGFMEVEMAMLRDIGYTTLIYVIFSVDPFIPMETPS